MNNAIQESVAPPENIAIRITGLTKKYGDFYAVSSVELTVKQGEIHSLVGQNGAGKSTLLGILSGRVAPTSGIAEIFGEELHYGEPRSSRRLGIATIYQELTIVPNLTAVENVFLGQVITKNGFVSFQTMKERFMELCAVMGVTIPPFKLARELSIADQQILEIMRGLRSNARILILDEPTASLAPPERSSLLKRIKSLREQGITIIYVSHHLEEVMEISDSITVLRNGEKVETQPRAHWTKDSMVSMMMGKDVEDDLIKVISEEEKCGYVIDNEVLRAENITIPGLIENVSLTIKQGEILGIGGLVGSRRTELVRALAGLESDSSGDLWIDGKKVNWPKNPRMAIKYGIALAPEDRKHQGLVLDFSCQDNINMVDFKKVKRFGIYDTKRAAGVAVELGERFGLTRPIQTLCKNLSGGNQQKILLSKVCNANPKVLIVDEPTRGIDIGVKIEVLKILKKLAGEGMAVIIISSELEEIVAVSDRVLVLSKGKKVKELIGKEEVSVSNILYGAFQGGAS